MDPATRYAIVSSLLVVSLNALASLVAIWSALSPRHRILRALAFFAVPGALLYAQAAEPAVGLFVEMSIISGVLLLVRRVRQVREGPDQSALRKLQFTFRDVLFVVFLIAVVLGGAMQARKYQFTEAAGFSFLWDEYFGLLQCAGLAIVSLTATWSVFATRRRCVRVGVIAVAVGLVDFSIRGLALALGKRLVLEDSWYSFAMLVIWFPSRWHTLLLHGMLAVVVATYLYVWRAALRHEEGTEDASGRGRSRHLNQMARIAGVCILSILLIAPAGYLYYELVRPYPVPADDSPSPNGYDQLVDAGNAVQFLPGVAIALPSATTAQLALFVQQNERILLDARKALAVPSRLRVSYTEFRLDHAQQFRTLLYAFDALGRLQIQNAEWAEASRTYRDVLLLADRTERGGLINDMTSGVAIAGTAFVRLEQIVPHLTATQCRELIHELLDYEQGREPLPEIQQRNDLQTRVSLKWLGRWTQAVESFCGAPQNKALFEEVRRLSQAEARMLMCDLAIHAYWRDHGTLPDYATRLVPAYLTDIPTDPHDGQPLRLIFGDGTYTVYSVGPNGRDDGGQANRDAGDWPVVQRTVNAASK